MLIFGEIFGVFSLLFHFQNPSSLLADTLSLGLGILSEDPWLTLTQQDKTSAICLAVTIPSRSKSWALKIMAQTILFVRVNLVILLGDVNGSLGTSWVYLSLHYENLSMLSIFVILLFENKANQLFSGPKINACIWMSSVNHFRYKRRSPYRGKSWVQVNSCDAWAWKHFFSDVSNLLSGSSTFVLARMFSIIQGKIFTRRKLANGIQIIPDYYWPWLEFFRK